MNLKEIGVNTTNFIDSAHDGDLLKSSCECDIELPDAISHGVN